MLSHPIVARGAGFAILEMPERLCTSCNHIEDEKHFLHIHCKRYGKLRENYSQM